LPVFARLQARDPALTAPTLVLATGLRERQRSAPAASVLMAVPASVPRDAVALAQATAGRPIPS